MKLPELFKNKYAPLALCALFVIDLILWGVVFSAPSGGSTALYFLNIGQGDSELVELAGGVHVLIDGGPSGKALLENLANVLPPTKKYIDLIVMTHPQADHFAGLIDVLKNYEVGAFISSGRKADVSGYPELHDLLEKKQVPYIQLKEGDSIKYGDAIFSVLSPSSQDMLSGEFNDVAIVMLLETPEFKALYTGDIGENIEKKLAQKYDIDVDILKVGHHGSKFSSSAGFLKEVSPQFSIIEVGKNTYGHPTAEALKRLKEFGDKIFRTDKDGIIKIVYENGALVKK